MMNEPDVLARFAALLPRFGRLRSDLHWAVPSEEVSDLLGLFNKFGEMRSDARWITSPSSYENLFELILQYFVYRTLVDPPPELKLQSSLRPSNVCVRFVPSPHFIVEVVPADPFFYIVLSEPTYSLPLHVGMALSLLSVKQSLHAVERATQHDLLGGASAAQVIREDTEYARHVLNSLYASGMDAAMGTRPHMSADFLIALDKENQTHFRDAAVRLLRWGGESPFEFGIHHACSFFSLVFLLYGVMHELGHLWFRHSVGLRDLGEELGCDLAAAAAIERLFPSASCRVPVSVGAASVFYGVMRYVSFLQARERLFKGESDDSQYYRSLEQICKDESFGEFWEHKLLASRALGAAASVSMICAPYSMGQRDDIRLFWTMVSEIDLVTACAIDEPLRSTSGAGPGPGERFRSSGVNALPELVTERVARTETFIRARHLEASARSGMSQ